jgi:hypothetical protein
MNNLSKTSKTILVFTFISYSLWLGSYVAKNLILFQFFEPETMALKNIFAKGDLFNIFYSFYPVVTLNVICYALFLICFIAFVVTSRLNLRNNGWLFISLLVVLITMPVEIYLIIKYELNLIIDTNNMTLAVQPAIELLKQRVARFGMYSFVSIFSTLSIILFFIFKPLTKNEN